MEYKQALKQIENDLGPLPVLRTVEPTATIVKLHRQGNYTLACRSMFQAYVPVSETFGCGTARSTATLLNAGMRVQDKQNRQAHESEATEAEE